MIGRTLGNYRITEQIGMGGMATVYKAYDPSMDRYVAVKVLPEHYSQDPKFRERFRREARAIARLEHPNILPVFTYGEEGDTAYLVMRYLPGGTLKDRIQAGPMPLADVSAILGQVASALDYAHEHHILHRDVKPSNIMLDGKGNTYLTDFGIAKMVEASVELTGGSLLGTPAYMSPEQCQGGKDLTPVSDQYSLGTVLYEMLTGQTPFRAETPLALIYMHLNDPLPPPTALRPDLPEEAEKVILKALTKNPHDRFAGCSQMAQALAKAVEGMPFEAPTKSASTTRPDALTFDETVPRPARRRRSWWIVAALPGVAVVAGIIGFVLKESLSPGGTQAGEGSSQQMTTKTQAESSSTESLTAIPTPHPVATPLSGSPADQARAFAEPILAAIANRPPSYRDDFSDPSSGWLDEGLDGHSGYVSGEYFLVTDPVSTSFASSGNNYRIPSLSDMVLEVDTRFVTEQVLGHLSIRFHEQASSGANIGIGVVSDGRVNLGWEPGSYQSRDLVEQQVDPANADAKQHVQMIVQGGEIAVYVDDRPLIYYDRDGIVGLPPSGTISFVACTWGNEMFEVRLDNLRIWDISDLELP